MTRTCSSNAPSVARPDRSEPQCQGVGEQAEQRLQFEPVTVRHRRTDDHVVLSAQSAQQHGPGGQQRHERRGTNRACERADTFTTAGGTVMRAEPPRDVATAGRGRSDGMVDCAGAPRQVMRQYSAWRSMRSPASARRCTPRSRHTEIGRSGSGKSPQCPAEYAAYSTLSSCISTLSDQPSKTM